MCVCARVRTCVCVCVCVCVCTCARAQMRWAGGGGGSWVHVLLTQLCARERRERESCAPCTHTCTHREATHTCPHAHTHTRTRTHTHTHTHTHTCAHTHTLANPMPELDQANRTDVAAPVQPPVAVRLRPGPRVPRPSVELGRFGSYHNRSTCLCWRMHPPSLVGVCACGWCGRTGGGCGPCIEEERCPKLGLSMSPGFSARRSAAVCGQTPLDQASCPHTNSCFAQPSPFIPPSHPHTRSHWCELVRRPSSALRLCRLHIERVLAHHAHTCQALVLIPSPTPHPAIRGA